MNRFHKAKVNKARCEVTNKIRYRDTHEATHALTVARHMRAEHEARGITSSRRESRPYECEHCDGVHLTSNEDRIEDRTLPVAS